MEIFGISSMKVVYHSIRSWATKMYSCPKHKTEQMRHHMPKSSRNSALCITCISVSGQSSMHFQRQTTFLPDQYHANEFSTIFIITFWNYGQCIFVFINLAQRIREIKLLFAFEQLSMICIFLSLLFLFESHAKHPRN